MTALGRWAKGSLTDNVGLKLLSLVLAVGLVVYQRGQRDDRLRTIAVGVVWHTPPESERRELMTSMPSVIHVTVRGPRRNLEELIEAGVPPITLDLRDGQRERVTFEPGAFEFPPELEVKIVDPAGIDLSWEDIVEREIVVQSSLTGLVAKGFETGNVSVDPSYVAARGPRSVVEAMQFVRLTPFDVTGLTGGQYQRQVSMDAAPSRVRYLSAPNATVSVEIRRREIPVKFPERKVEVVGLVGARTEPSVVEVKVTGPPEVVNALRAQQIVPRVDLQEAGIDINEGKHGTAALRVSVDLANVKVEVQPPTVFVRW